MGKINVLGFDVANLIAAGEVVDRPSSVVKELLENAIDSGADKIIIEIKKGGVAFIRITDNGCGISYEDLPVSILRHATSKIKDSSDLDSIMTLGFRGEALAAISSVSKMRILSKQPKEQLGAMLEAHAGKMISCQRAGGENGTTVIVEDLFYNVPARKKFLKQDKTEALAISGVVEKVALSRPDISFRYIVDGELKYLTAGDGSLSNVIYAILGRDVSKKTIKVEREDGGIKVSGFISTPELCRANRNLENFYINSRFVKSKTAGAALEQAYKSYIPEGKFPFCVLDIVIDPSEVDVNVHPAKLEVKFSNEAAIFDAVYYAVRTALSTSIERPSLYDEPSPKNEGKELLEAIFTPKSNNEYKAQRISFDTRANVGVVMQNNTLDYSSLDKKQTPEQKSTEVKDYGNEEAFSLNFPKKAPSKPREEASFFNFAVNEKIDLGEKFEPEPKKEPTQKCETKIVPDYKIIGELYNSYVIVELGDIAYIIDKHAAHERIIFEDLKAKINSQEPTSQILLLPIEIPLTSKDEETLANWAEDIKKTGFGYKINANCAEIYEIPSEIEVSAAEDSFLALLEQLASGEGEASTTRYARFEKALYQTSCKAAIKAGRVYDTAHVKWICDRVLTLDNIKYCPHGRPVAFEITKSFLEKQFERK